MLRDQNLMTVGSTDALGRQGDGGMVTGDNVTFREHQHPVGVLRGEVQVVEDGQNPTPSRHSSRASRKVAC